MYWYGSILPQTPTDDLSSVWKSRNISSWSKALLQIRLTIILLKKNYTRTKHQDCVGDSHEKTCTRPAAMVLVFVHLYLSYCTLFLILVSCCYFVCIIWSFFGHRHFLLFRPRVFSLALDYGARRRPPWTLVASAGPGQGPWHVLWGFKIAKTGK